MYDIVDTHQTLEKLFLNVIETVFSVAIYEDNQILLLAMR